MNGPRIKRLTVLSIGALAAMFVMEPQFPAQAADGDVGAAGATTPFTPIARRLQMGVGKSIIIDLPAEASEIFVGDPKVANAIVRSARRLYIDTIANGSTSIFAMDRQGRQIAVLDITVGRDVGELKQILDAAIPGNDIRVKTVSDSVILIGSVANAGDAQKAVDIANGFVGTSVVTGGASGGGGGGGGAAGGTSTTLSVTNGSTPISGKVINSLIIRGLDQVALRVTVTEIRREIIKQLGVNLSGQSASGNSFAIQNPFAISGAVGASDAILNWSKGGSNLSATLEALERQGVARTLAEPTVTAISGESAKFLAGGTIPIANSLSCTNGALTGNVCLEGLIQQPYGVTLNFTPVVLSQGRIQLRIATEVTDIDYSHQVTITAGNSNVSVPGFRTRKNETTVELPSGGSIASAGLLSTQTQQAINGVPGLMNLPILGSLFRSRDFLRDETELLIIVSPYIVHAIDPAQIVKPDANFSDASDPQTWLLGRVNRLYSTTGSAQGLQNYTGKVGFIND